MNDKSIITIIRKLAGEAKSDPEIIVELSKLGIVYEKTEHIAKIRKTHGIKSGQELKLENDKKLTIKIWNETHDIGAIVDALGVHRSGAYHRLRQMVMKGEIEPHKTLEKKERVLQSSTVKKALRNKKEDVIINTDFSSASLKHLKRLEAEQIKQRPSWIGEIIKKQRASHGVEL